LFSKSLTKHKKEPTTQIWEFGIADLLSGQIMPACRTFPDNSGGFVTTDIHNIIQNPAIIDVISTQIEKVRRKKNTHIKSLVFDHFTV
jgi:hypothetical protein